MSNGRLEALAVRSYKDSSGQEKASFTKVGVAFPLKHGEGYQVLLDAMPAPQDGQFKILLKPPQERGGY
jgi:hypothetical protein